MNRTRVNGVICGLFFLANLLPPYGCGPRLSPQPPFVSFEKVHNNGTTRVAFSPKGDRLASGGYLGEVVVRSVPKGDSNILLKDHADKIRYTLGNKAILGLAWVSESLLAAGMREGRIMLWDVSNGESVASHMTSSPMSDLAVAPEKDVIITGHMDGTVRAFSIPRLLPQAEYHMGATVMSVDCDEKTGTVAAVAEGGRLSLLTKDMTWMRDLDVSPRDVFDLRFSPDGRQLAGGAWFAWLFWDIRQGTVRIKRSPHFGKAIAIDYSPDGKWLVSLGRITDGNIYLLNLQTDFVERRLEAHVSCGGAVRFGPKGHFIASGGDDESVRIYDFRRGAHKQINNECPSRKYF